MPRLTAPRLLGCPATLRLSRPSLPVVVCTGGAVGWALPHRGLWLPSWKGQWGVGDDVVVALFTEEVGVVVQVLTRDLDAFQEVSKARRESGRGVGGQDGGSQGVWHH